MSVQIPPEDYKFLEGILADSDMKDLDEEMRDAMIGELYERFDAFVIGEITTHMSSKDGGTLISMHEQQRPKAEIDKYVKEHVPNAGQIIANSRPKFRELYLRRGA